MDEEAQRGELMGAGPSGSQPRHQRRSTRDQMAMKLGEGLEGESTLHVGFVWGALWVGAGF